MRKNTPPNRSSYNFQALPELGMLPELLQESVGQQIECDLEAVDCPAVLLTGCVPAILLMGYAVACPAVYLPAVDWVRMHQQKDFAE